MRLLLSALAPALAIGACLAGPAAAEDCEPKYGWNPLSWWQSDLSASLCSHIQQQLDELRALPPEQLLARVNAAKAQGGGDPSKLLQNLGSVIGSSPASSAPRPAASTVATAPRDLDASTR